MTDTLPKVLKITGGSDQTVAKEALDLLLEIRYRHVTECTCIACTVDIALWERLRKMGKEGRPQWVADYAYRIMNVP